MQLFNSIVVPIVIALIADKKVLTSGGVTTDVFFIGIFNVLPPIGRFIDPYSLWLRCQASSYDSADSRLNISQPELNQLLANH